MRRATLVFLAVAVVLLVFLAFGPVGLGNGPLQPISTDGGWPARATPSSAAIHVLLIDTGPPAVMQGVSLLGANGYPKPRLLRVMVQPSDGCESTIGPLQSAGCGGQPTPAIGATVPGGSNARHYQPRDKDLVLVVGVPRSDCDVVTAIVLRYRVGWRHFAATAPESFVSCGATTSATYAAQAARVAQAH